MDRRATLKMLARTGFGVLALSPPAQGSAAPSTPGWEASGKTGMRHRSYAGKILYLSDGVGEQGREFFSVTVQPDGVRTLRAQVEMDNDRLLRDVVLTVDGDFRPIDAFVRLTIEEQFVGSSWYSFSETTAECEGRTAVDGRISEKAVTKDRIKLFTCHPINCDAWLWGAVRRSPDLSPYPWFNTSVLPNGGSGPTLLAMRPGRVVITDVGAERVAVRAGTFEAHHFQLGVRGSTAPPLNTWVFGEDCVPLRLRSEQLKQTFELVEFSGDAI